MLRDMPFRLALIGRRADQLGEMAHLYVGAELISPATVKLAHDSRPSAGSS